MRERHEALEQIPPPRPERDVPVPLGHTPPGVEDGVELAVRGRRDAADRVDEPVDVLGVDHPAVLAAAHEVGGLPDARRHERHARRHRLQHRARPAFVTRGDEAHVDRRVHLRDLVDVGK